MPVIMALTPKWDRGGGGRNEVAAGPPLKGEGRAAAGRAGGMSLLWGWGGGHWGS